MWEQDHNPGNYYDNSAKMKLAKNLGYYRAYSEAKYTSSILNQKDEEVCFL